MFIVHVTLIAKTRGPNQLTYFCVENLPIGSIVKVPLKRKLVPALVIEVESARAIKAILRTNKYATRKIKPQKIKRSLTAAFVKAACETSEYFVANTGAVVESFTPKAVLEDALDVDTPSNSTRSDTSAVFEKQVLQLPRSERLDAYKTLIRAAFSQKHSVYLCVPTIIEAQTLHAELSRGIEKYIFVFASTQTKKRQVALWKQALGEAHPIVIIATAGFISIPRVDIRLYILERELAGSFKQMHRPFIDARFMVEAVAKNSNAKLVVADTFVRIATHHELMTGSANELEERSRRVRTQSRVELIDLRIIRKEWKETKEISFPILSPQSIKLLKDGMQMRKHIFVFAARRGIAPHSVCNDCAKIVRCKHCKASVVLHELQRKRVLMCHRCGASRDAHETCEYCGSWNLISLGVGIERVYDYVKENLPNAPMFLVDVDTTKKSKDVQATISNFNDATEGAILVGTTMALPYITEPFDACVISSLDSLMSIPDFRIEEKLFGLLMTVSEKTKNKMFIETSAPENAMLKAIRSGNVSLYTREELNVREQFKYPPYTVLIKITREGTRDAVIEDMQRFVRASRQYSPRVFSTLVKGAKVGFALSALIRVPKDSWPNSDLLNILQALPASFLVDVEPERAL